MSTVKKRSNILRGRWVRKRDGRLEPFNKSKIQSSILKAGVTRKQAKQISNTITERVRLCKLCKDINGKKEVLSTNLSTNVFSELQRFSRNAAESFSNHRNRRQKTPGTLKPFKNIPKSQEQILMNRKTEHLAYSNKKNSLIFQVSTINRQATNTNHSIENLNEKIQRLPARITRIRKGNYRVLSHLETDQTSLSEIWLELSPDLTESTRQKSKNIQSETRNLQRALAQNQRWNDYNLRNLQNIESKLSELRLNLSEIEGFVDTSLAPLEARYQSIDKDLRMAESTITLVSQASFPWIEGENPITAIKAKDLSNNLESVITLTNLRFILEHKKEKVLKKRFFIVTEKKIIREVAIHKPVGMVTRLTKGKVGFLKGSGLFVEFASESGIPEMKFDTKGNEANWMVQNYNYVISGQAEEELATITREGTHDQKSMQLIACQICGAPYKEKIYRGQTSVSCKYCGAVVALQ